MTDDDLSKLPPTSVPSDAILTVQGFANQEAAKQLADEVSAAIAFVGCFLDLSTLDGVTVAIDYDSALAGLDLGMPGLPTPTRSDTDEMQGVAKTVGVIRDGKAKSHLIFASHVLVPLIAPNMTGEEKSFSIGVIAHECAHVMINAQKEETIPDARLGAHINGYERACLFKVAEICWDEYAACRLSSVFDRLQNTQHVTTLIGVLRIARPSANEAIKAYRLHHDIHRVVSEAGSFICQPLKAAAYLLGALDGADQTLAEMPEAVDAIDEAGCRPLIDELHQELLALWETQGSWDASQEVLAPMMAFVKRAFSNGGLEFVTGPTGCRVNVPFTAETMPGA